VAINVRAEAGARQEAGSKPMTLAELSGHVDSAAAARRAAGSGNRAWGRYVQACSDYAGAAPLPLTPEKVLGFALCECLRGISSSSLKATCISLESHVREEGWEMSGWDTLAPSRIRRGLDALVHEFPTDVVRAKPMTDVIMRDVRAYLEPYLARGDLYALMWWAMLSVAYAGCLRSIEFLGDALTPQQVRVTHGPGGSMLELDLPFRKTHRNVRDEESDRVTLPPRRRADADLDALPAMQAYAVAAGIDLGTGPAPMFVRRRRSAPCGEVPERKPGYQYQTSLSELRWILGKEGLQAAEGARFSLHSLRRGGATRLLEIGVQWDIVKKLGGWAADTSLSNYDARGRALAASVTATDEQHR